MSIKDITIVITSFKSNDKINNCLKSIDRQCKVLLIENSNNLELKTKIEKEFSNVECILSGDNLGYGTANNIGLRKTKTKYALILNPDATLYPNSIENFLKNVEQIPDFAIMGPYIQEDKDKDKIVKKTSPIETQNVKGFAMILNLKHFKDI